MIHMIDEVNRDLATAVREHGSALLQGNLLALREMDRRLGGPDVWDQRPECEGVVFAVLALAVDPDTAAVAAAVLPELSQRVYDEAHRRDGDHGPGQTGQALARVALAVKGGNWTADLREIVADPNQRFTGIGFAAEAWSTERKVHERTDPDGWIKDEPGAVEIRFVTLVDLAGAEYVQVRVRGQDPEQGLYPPVSIGGVRGGFTGPVQRALRVLAATLGTTRQSSVN